MNACTLQYARISVRFFSHFCLLSPIIKVLVVNGKATAEIMNKHPSLRDAVWRIVAASMLLRNPRWVKDVTKASTAMSVAAKVGESGVVNEALSGTQPAWTIPAGVSSRQLALSIVQPHRSKRDRSRAGYIEIVINNRGLGSLAQQGYYGFECGNSIE